MRKDPIVRFLLPPSETKRDGTSKETLNLESLCASSLTNDRLRAIAALEKFCSKPTPRVREAIGTTANQDAELRRNTELMTAATSPAHWVYDGVLFDAIDILHCSAAVQRRIVERTLVQSALFGVVAFSDAIPAYRCSADSTLPRIGRLSAFWRERLPDVMPALIGDHFLLDMRSSNYAPMWNAGEIPHATVSIMQLRDGRRTAVSHMNKATKGQLVRGLCSQRRDARSTEEAAELIAQCGYEVALSESKGHPVIEVLVRGL